MKTAIFIPDPIFEAAEELAGRLKISRSQLYTKAVEVFVESQRRRDVTEVLNRIYSEEPSELDPAWSALQGASLPPADEW